MELKATKREIVLEEIEQVVESGEELKKELHLRGIETKDTTINEQVDNIVREKVWFYLEI